MSRLLFAAAVFLLSMGCTVGSAKAGDGSAFRVAGYLPDYRFAEFNPQSYQGLTDLILFSAEPAEDGRLDLRRLANCPWDKLLAYKTQQRVRLFLTIGGWDRSRNFGKVAASQERRKVFVDSVVELALKRRLDGIDLDWEHPQNEAEQAGYGGLLADLRSALKPHGIMLTVTIAAWQHLPASAIGSVDGVQVMAYDHEKQHSTFEGARRDVQVLLDAGIPANRIVLGLPFYGRNTQSRDASTYREIVAKFTPSPSDDQVGQVYFNGPDTIRRKVKYALDSHLAGVMIWELGQDASGDQSLLKVVQQAIEASDQRTR